MADPATNRNDLDLVRREVRQVLESSDNWCTMAPEKRRELANNMVKVSSYLARDPDWLNTEIPEERTDLAAALGPVDDLKKRLAEKPGQVGAEFKAGALREGTETFKQLVNAVDFPEFVSGLIQGVFQAIVDASIQQMEAYGELLAATSKTVGQFASDHISDAQAREHIASRHPSVVRIANTAEGAQLQLREEADDASALQALAGEGQTVDLDDPQSELKLVNAAKLEMARQRQKLMALMVLLGINRIIVTNGRINAKVVFDITASDLAERKASAGLTDTTSSTTKAFAGGFGIAPWGGGGGGVSTTQRHRTMVRSSVDDTSESAADMKAKLSGDVRVNFRSETLPPERMLDALQFDQINYLAQGSGQAPPVPAEQGAPGGG
ncbi:MAG: hypothetical protein KZQ88_03540 [Candidatus Thiodiazotropha sp. (ex Dulcina madagascariensis)]|nr:hypothetical protein [Candidatus Thiodiazotropha sp. (ex Dulcina madagascariensis)]MCU7925932.1 hypothetical protein [Candidatus Thiodiazotropha sp. (ex Dulcina madagascariensis)]